MLFERDGDGFGAVDGAEFPADGVEVLVDGVGRDAEIRGVRFPEDDGTKASARWAVPGMVVIDGVNGFW